jgi:DNA repair photolyase
MELKERFLNLPVSINNYYGDPVLQWNNTMQKIERLIKDKHNGIISLLTRGLITESKAKDLASLKYKKLVIIPPISHLKKIEIQNHEDRYKTIENCLKFGIKVVPNIRPLMLGQNDNYIDYIFNRLKNIGIKTVICSGIRGNDDILLNANISKEQLEQYCLRVKIIPKGVGNKLEEASQKSGIIVSKRVSCGVALELNEISHNPYWKSPQLAGCYTCPLKNKCFNKMIEKQEVPKEMEKFLNNLGYKWERVETFSHCNVQSEKRLECLSCCTACYIHGNNTIFIYNNKISLGTLSFLRFLFQEFTFTYTGIKDIGAKDTSVVYIPKLPDIIPEAINTWYVLARQLKKCFGCSYCIVDVYHPKQKEHGIYPIDLYNKINQFVED